MSAIDDFDLNKKLHFLLLEVRPVDDQTRQEKSLNSSFALSHGQLVQLLKLFKLNDVALRELNNLDHIWGVFQGVRKDRETGEYKRDQISILINVGNDRTTRLYIRPIRNAADRDVTLAELEKLRNPQQLLAYLGEIDPTQITRRTPGAGYKKPAAGGAKPEAGAFRGAGERRLMGKAPERRDDGAARTRPFEEKLRGFQPRA